MLGLQRTPPGKMRRACPRRAWSFSGSGEITSGAFRSWGEHSSIVYWLLVARTGKSSAVAPDPDKNGVRRDEWASLPRTGLLARNKLRIARDTDMMDDSRKKDRMYLQ